jgi:hypothetical protein
LEENGKFSTELYEKAENKYLYLPKHSTHPPGNLKGLVYGSINRILRLTTDPLVQQQAIHNLYNRLLARGYGHHLLMEIINKTHNTLSSQTSVRSVQVDMASTIILHLQYHPCDPTSKKVQEIFRREVLSPF